MTTRPTHPPGNYPDPVTCPIHESALEEIKCIVLDTRAEVRELKEIGGPIVTIQHTADVAHDMGKRAHKRIDNLEREQNKLIVKVATIVAIISTVANFGVAEFFK